MRRGLALSVLLHISVGLFFWIEMPKIVLPEREVKLLNVTLAKTPDKVKKVEQEAKAKKPKKVYTQQSAAPKEAPKKQEEVKKPKNPSPTKIATNEKTKKIKQEQENKKEVKKQEKSEKSNNKDQIGTRPEKLDKTPDKKNVLKSDNKKDRTNEEDDFLNTLDFIDDLEKEQDGSVKGEDEEGEGQVFDVDQLEIAKIKKLVQSNWYVTAGANKQRKLEAIVRVNLDRDGSVKRVKLVSSSGEPHFDRSLQRAVRKSSPLPIPLSKYEIYKTIELRFSR